MPASSISSLPTDVQLLLMLCRHPAERIEADEAARLSSEITDWDRFLSLAAHHRLMPLLAKHAALVPYSENVSNALRSKAAANAVEAFRSLVETQRLLGLLSAAGIGAAVLKGVPLSLQAYGDVSTRDVGDIDLLIRPEEAETADRVLAEQGMQRKDPAGKLTPRRRASYSAHFKDYTYEPLHLQTQGGFELDLHWRLFRNPRMPGNTLISSRETLHAGALSMTTLSIEANLLYLAVQGALDGWTRFKAVADIAALWNAIGDHEQAVALAADHGVTPYLHAALQLAATWIGGIELPGQLVEARTPMSERIVTAARQRMLEANFLPDLRETSSWAMKAYEASLHDSFGYKLAIGRRILFRPRVWTRFDLPDGLFSLYPLLSPLEWMLFHLDHESETPS